MDDAIVLAGAVSTQRRTTVECGVARDDNGIGTMPANGYAAAKRLPTARAVLRTSARYLVRTSR
jgi:hypothetical protein